MKFTYAAYEALINSVIERGYQLADYHTYENKIRPCILRHDIDMDLAKAVEFSEFESKIKEGGVRSTYFILLTSDFYNPSSAQSMRHIRKIQSWGHEIGLHFDEKRYTQDGPLETEELKANVMREVKLLSGIIGRPVTVVSMHRPSAGFLETDMAFEGLVNSYSKEFFHSFKYLSDSRMNWREDVEQIVREGRAPALHLLTHPLWYTKEGKGTKEILEEFLGRAYGQRYDTLSENFRDLEEFIKADGKEETKMREKK